MAVLSQKSDLIRELTTWVKRYSKYLRTAMVCAYVLSFLLFVVVTLHWRLEWDAVVFHYVNFLIAHGMAPYRDISDINMPGAYILDYLQMHIFGPGDFAWRMYEYFLLGCLAVAMIVIALPYEWIAGLAAAVLFSLMHATGGAMQSGQRDEAIAILLISGYAFLFQAVRKLRPMWMSPFGVLVAGAVTVKPTFLPLLVLLPVMALLVLKRRGEPLLHYALYTVAGALIPAAVVAGFLLKYHAVASFFDLSTRLTPYYASLKQVPLLSLLGGLLPPELLVLVILGLILIACNPQWLKDWRDNWEEWALLVGAAIGALSFIIQRKGFSYQRYTLCAFALMLVSIEVAKALRSELWIRKVGAALGVLYATLYLLPIYLHHIPDKRRRVDNSFRATLQTDLTRLGGDSLQHQVQCLDMVDGCMAALYHLNLVQNTGFTGDTLFFVRKRAPAVDYYRAIFWNDLHTSPPKVIVLSDEQFDHPRGFDKLDRWPEFRDYLNQSYTLVQTRTFDSTAYRIYVMKS